MSHHYNFYVVIQILFVDDDFSKQTKPDNKLINSKKNSLVWITKKFPKEFTNQVLFVWKNRHPRIEFE